MANNLSSMEYSISVMKNCRILTDRRLGADEYLATYGLGDSLSPLKVLLGITDNIHYSVQSREMEKVDSFAIFFDRKVAIFKPGEEISGHIDIQLNTAVKTKGVILNVVGIAHAKWREREPNSNDTAKFVCYENDEVYMNKKIRLCGEDRGWLGDNPTLPVGCSSFPFTFNLPLNGPPSFEGGTWKGKSLGYIRYYCKAHIARSWGFDYVVKEVFTVLPVRDLQHDPSASLALNVESSKLLKSCFCRSGVVFCHMNISKRGYVPGESIAVSVKINNRSPRVIETIDLKLVQSAIYSADRRDSQKSESRLPERASRIDRRILSQTQESINCPALSAISLHKQLHIPAVVADVRDCPIIRVEYAVHSTLTARGTKTKLNTVLPITIGTVPFYNIVEADSVRLLNNEDPAAVFFNSCEEESFSTSYEDCFFGKVNVREEDENEFTLGSSDFAPKYAFYENLGH